PPLPTLFPYTTLFRSVIDLLPHRPTRRLVLTRLVLGVRRHLSYQHQPAREGAVELDLKPVTLRDSHDEPRPLILIGGCSLAPLADRKSTRLNSSHRTI